MLAVAVDEGRVGQQQYPSDNFEFDVAGVLGAGGLLQVCPEEDLMANDRSRSVWVAPLSSLSETRTFIYMPIFVIAFSR